MSLIDKFREIKCKVEWLERISGQVTNVIEISVSGKAYLIYDIERYDGIHKFVHSQKEAFPELKVGKRVRMYANNYYKKLRVKICEEEVESKRIKRYKCKMI